MAIQDFHKISHTSNAFTAMLVRHDLADDVSVLRWGTAELRVPLAQQFVPGSRVTWTIPPSEVRLLSNSKRQMRPDDTPIEVDLIDVRFQEGRAKVTARRVDEPSTLVRMEADAQIAADHGVRQGARLIVRLRGASIQVITHAS